MYQFNEKQTVSLFLSNLLLIETVSGSTNGKIELYKHSELGQVLIINDEIQHVEAWASLYHEIVVHLPCLFIEEVKRVLILGGGSLYAAKEVLKYESVKEVVLVDFDKEVINLIVRNCIHAQKTIKDPRLIILNKEALNYINSSNSKFDFILNDSIDLLNNSEKFVNVNPFKLLAERLTINGVCSDVIYRHIFERKTVIKTLELLQQHFNSIFSLITIPEYPGILHLLSIWGYNKNINQMANAVINKTQIEWLTNPKSSPCEIYNPSFLPFYLYLPPYLKNEVNLNL